jgi:D-glycero-D-manno-heptose 1,7-bisphosphate phosphatase
MRPAVFLDRDGTLIEHVHHLTDPGDVRLVAGAGAAVERLRRAGFACVVVTNQSVVGRGMLTEAGLDAVHAVMDRQLADQGTGIDALYFCPTKPTTDDPAVVEDPDRKPGPGMLRRAAREHGLDLGASWMVGDSLGDMLAGRNAGCRATVLVRTGHGTGVDASHPAVDYVAPDLPAAVELILRAVGAA